MVEDNGGEVLALKEFFDEEVPVTMVINLDQLADLPIGEVIDEEAPVTMVTNLDRIAGLLTDGHRDGAKKGDLLVTILEDDTGNDLGLEKDRCLAGARSKGYDQPRHFYSLLTRGSECAQIVFVVLICTILQLSQECTIWGNINEMGKQR
eukprot:TRINITY_DN3421_c0_g1_i2.p4 TRINITY_DN3421_c0_g1~~TRINITY_DN3421_c0_g1_i2.p4  ORF type:complete len:150 (+),score=11.05 TRINITY_DN3421_c0_g1_i2:383-832(+)